MSFLDFSWLSKSSRVMDGMDYPPAPASTNPPEVDDWVEIKSNWCEREVCHCRQARKHTVYCGFSFTGPAAARVTTYDVCPKCGHKDKWEKFVCRDVWEESPARQAYWGGLGRAGLKWSEWHRNERVERWTPEHCEVKD